MAAASPIAESSIPDFEIRLLGPFQLFRRGEALDTDAWQQSVQTLIKLLAMSHEHRRLRDELIDTLWPDALPHTGAGNLRYILGLARRSLGGDPPPVLSQRQWISLNPTYEWRIDLEQLESVAAKAVDLRAVADGVSSLYRGEPLPENRYDEWALPVRAHVQKIWRSLCLRVAASYREHGQIESALQWLERVLAVDPVDEEVVQQQLRDLDAIGRRPEALRRFVQFEQQLRSEVDVTPSAESLALVAELRDVDHRLARRKLPATPRSEERSPQRLPTGNFLGALPSQRIAARTDELRRLEAALDAVAAGEGRLILLAGEPGVGKTRLLQELTVKARGRGFLIAAGRSYEHQQGTALFPFTEAYAMLFAAVPELLRTEILRQRPLLGRLLPEAAGLYPQGEPEKDEQLRLFRTVTEFVQHVSTITPVALLLDDLHWADESSLHLLHYLAGQTRGHPVLLAGTYRDTEVGRQHPLERMLLELGRERLEIRIPVRPLGEEGTADLMRAAFGEADFPAALIRLVHERTEGNAYFTEELLRSLHEQGDVYARDGQWHISNADTIPVPDSVRLVIGQRLARLPRRVQEVLHEASVLGQTFQFDDVRRLENRTESEIEEVLEAAIESGLVREIEADQYSFAHALAQQALYQDLSARKRRRLHLQAGKALEALSREERTARAAELTWHFRRSNQVERALPWALVAGERASSLFAYAEAEVQYRLAQELARELPADHPLRRDSEAQALILLGNAIQHVGRYGDALEAYEEAATICRGYGDLQGEAMAVVEIAWTRNYMGAPQEAMHRVRPMLERLQSQPPSEALVRLYIVSCRILTVLGEYRPALESADRALALAHTLGHDGLNSVAREHRDGVLWLMGRRSGDLEGLEELIHGAETDGDMRRLSNLLDDAALMLHYRGEFEKGRAYLERAIVLARKVGDPYDIAWKLNRLGSTHFMLGAWKRARACIREAMETTRLLEGGVVPPYPLIDLGHLNLCEGDWVSARRDLEEGLGVAEHWSNLQAVRYAHMRLALLDTFEEHPERAVERLTPLLDRAGTEETLVTPLLPILADAYLQLGDVAQAEILASDAIRRATSQENVLDLIAARLSHGRVLTRQERWDEASADFDAILHTVRALPFPHAEALTLLEYGRLSMRRGQPTAAQMHLEEALLLFDRLGAQGDARSTRSLLTQLDRDTGA